MCSNMFSVNKYTEYDDLNGYICIRIGMISTRKTEKILEKIAIVDK